LLLWFESNGPQRHSRVMFLVFQVPVRVERRHRKMLWGPPVNPSMEGCDENILFSTLPKASSDAGALLIRSGANDQRSLP
jgi:hypothetical protein